MTITRIISSKLFFVSLLVMFRALLDYYYVIFISPNFENDYNRFQLNFHLNNYILSWLFFIAGIMLVKHCVKKVSDYFFLMALLNVIAPLSSLYGLDTTRSIFPVIVTMVSLYFVAAIALLPIFPTPKIPYFKNSRKFVIYVSCGSVLCLVVWFIISGAVANINFDPRRVYEFREENSDLISAGIMGYFSIWTYKAFNIFLILIALHRKKYLILILLLIIQLFFYGVSAHKAVVFFPLLAIGVWYYFRATNLSFILPVGFMGIMILAYVLYLIFDSQYISSIVIRRVFYVPASATYSYFEFFDRSDYIYWGDSVLSSFVQYDYSKPLSRVIGDFMNPGGELGANNGFISRGFAHAGLLGVFVYSIIAGYLLKVLDSLSRSGVPLWFSLGITIIPLRTFLVSSDLFTTLLSHGLLLSFLLVIMFRAKNKSPNIMKR